MPYTPPSHRSPASSAPTSPDASRRPSFQAGGRPSLPRSASYLTRHRRTPSAVSTDSHGSARQITPDATSEDLKALVTSSSSVRQSPPPVTDDRQLPKGAVLSPPESPPSSDEDELPEVRGRKIDNLKELHDAISQIPQHRESSPTKTAASRPEASDVLLLPSQASGLHQSFSTGSLENLAHGGGGGGRRISHVRSGTDPGTLVTKSADNSLTASEEESEEEILKKPQMVRKKSGELVRPALRPPSRRRPSSMPGTPTFSKAVHFDSHLEHVRHFLQVDRPLAVSAGSSPADNYESDCEYPFPGDEQRRSPPFEWDIIVTNFPLETAARKLQPVRLERVWLSNDQKCLTGSIAVANLAFQKSVACRFTLDYWKTTSEVAAEYVAEIRPKETPQGHDRFQFTIKLSDLANLESKTLYFCVRYNVAGREFWDNNSGINFQVDFKKKMLPQNGKNGIQGAASRPANALPRSNRRANPSTAPRPRSMPVGFDDFGATGKIDFSKTQSLQDYLGESAPALRLKGVKSTTSLPSDNLTARLSSPSGQAFANRYDFGASLSAAVQAAKDSMSKSDGGLYMRSGRKAPATTAGAAAAAANNANNASTAVSSDKAVAPSAAKESSVANEISAAINKALPAVPSGIGSPSMSNASYDEIVSKYCFYGSKQSSPQIKDGTLRSGQLDGGVGDGYATRSTNSSNSSSTGSPLQMGSMRHIHGAQHHSLHPADPNPYFEHATVITTTLGGSPASSPLHHPSSQRTSSNNPAAPHHHQPRISPAVSSQASNRSVSPASMVGAFAPLAGTSPNVFPFAQLQDRFPFTGTETHTATAIRG